MAWLELKIPPILVLVVFLVLNWILALQTFRIDISFVVKGVFSTLFVIGGVVLCFAGVFSFRKAKTTVNPLNPESSTTLVATGVYRYTRNPMYLGFLCIVVAWSIYLTSPVSIVGIVGFIVYMNQFQIKPEECILADRFPADYQHYLSKVRRWL